MRRLYPPTLAVLLATSAGLTVSGEVAAHGGPFSYVMNVFMEDGELAGGAVSYGLVQLVGDSALFTPEQAIGPGEQARWYERMPDGRILVGTYVGISETTDWGCSWTAHTGLVADQAVAMVARDPEAPTHLFAPTTTGGSQNGLLESTDAGVTWAPTGLRGVDAFLKVAIVAPGAAELWVAGIEFATQSPLFFHSTDGGATFEPIATDVQAFESVRLLSRTSDGAFHLASTSAGVDVLLSSVDGLASVQEDATFDTGVISAYAELAGYRFVTICYQGQAGQCTNSYLYRAASGESFVLSDDGPTRCLLPSIEPGALWGCAWLGQPYHFYRTVDGDTWEGFVPFRRLCARECPVDSAGAVEQDARWQALLDMSVGVDCGASDDAGIVTPVMSESGGAAGAPSWRDAGAVDAGVLPATLGGGGVGGEAASTPGGGADGGGDGGPAAGSSCGCLVVGPRRAGLDEALALLAALLMFRRGRRRASAEPRSRAVDSCPHGNLRRTVSPAERARAHRSSLSSPGYR